MTTDVLMAVAARVTVLLALAWGVTLAARRAPASIRHLVWITALLGTLAVPLASRLVPAREVRVPDIVAPLLVQTSAATAVAPAALDWARVVFWIWLAGALLVLLRLVAGMVQVARINRSASPFDSNRVARVAARLGAKTVTVKTCCGIPTAFTWGIWRPVVLLPESAADWSEERFDAVLAHEMMHIRRRDCLIHWPAQLACALYWFHPLVWMAEAKARQERERACDDGVLALGFEPADYAVHLLELARGFGAPGAWSAAVAMARPSELEGRLVSILNPRQSRGRASRWHAALAAVAAAVLIWPVATMRAPAQTPDGGRLKGVVMDASGAVVPKAMLAVSGNRMAETTVSNEAGEYDFRILPPGRYTLEVAAPGFAKARNLVEVKANEVSRMDVTLALGQVHEKLTVSGSKGVESVPQPRPEPKRVRVGGNVQPVKLLYQTKPEYPQRLYGAKVSGKAVLRAVILKNGSVGPVEVIETLGDPEFGQAAADAVRLWQYQPTLLNGEPVEVVTNVTVDFLIQ